MASTVTEYPPSPLQVHLEQQLRAQQPGTTLVMVCPRRHGLSTALRQIVRAHGAAGEGVGTHPHGEWHEVIEVDGVRLVAGSKGCGLRFDIVGNVSRAEREAGRQVRTCRVVTGGLAQYQFVYTDGKL
jgi:hypothetical protein